MFLLIMARMPVALSMLAVGSAGYVYFVGLSSFLNFLNATPYYLFANYTLSFIPLFVLMGAFAERSGLARDLFALCSILVGRMRGGLGISVIAACSIFGAICGSSLATTATFSRAALPEMKRLRYEPAFGSAIIAVGGVVDLLIPPSIILVIYAIIAEQNIAKLFQAALVPGIFAVVLYCLVIRIVASRNPGLAPIHEKADGETRLSGSLLSVWPALLVIRVGRHLQRHLHGNRGGRGRGRIDAAGGVDAAPPEVVGFRLQPRPDSNHFRDDLRRPTRSRGIQRLSCAHPNARGGGGIDWWPVDLALRCHGGPDGILHPARRRDG
jgi:TRAP-type mannitol/chloroaromatic compound transport system permease large subunit